jgi:hypothetical protein
MMAAESISIIDITNNEIPSSPFTYLLEITRWYSEVNAMNEFVISNEKGGRNLSAFQQFILRNCWQFFTLLQQAAFHVNVSHMAGGAPKIFDADCNCRMGHSCGFEPVYSRRIVGHLYISALDNPKMAVRLSTEENETESEQRDQNAGDKGNESDVRIRASDKLDEEVGEDVILVAYGFLIVGVVANAVLRLA